MRALRLVALAACLVSPLTTSAQGNSDADIFGVYVAPVFVTMPPLTQPDVYPFTLQAEEFFNSYDPLVQDARSTNDCAAETMPGILWNGSPMEFFRDGDTIVMRFERLGTTRHIHMDGNGPPADQPNTELGYSVGRWDGDVLTVETTHTKGGVIRNLRGHPLSPNARFIERYWRDPGEMDLNLELVIEDPANYTEAITLGREWVWAPAEEIKPWECISLGPKDAEPDVDELIRMLEQL